MSKSEELLAGMPATVEAYDRETRDVVTVTGAEFVAGSGRYVDLALDA